MNRFTAKGLTGSVRIGGRDAVTLGEWSFLPGPSGWRVTATVQEANPVWLASGGPFALHLDVGKEGWRFRDVEVVISPDHNAATITGTNDPEE